MKQLSPSDFHTGQIVYLCHARGFVNHGKVDDYIRTATVVSVKRKYLTVDLYGEIQFDMENNFREKSEYEPNWILFLSKQDIYDHLRQIDLRRIVRDKVERYSKDMSIEDLEQIESILDKYTMI